MDITSHMEQLYNNRDKQKSISLAHEYYRSFLDNEAIPGIEVEYQLVSQLLPQLPVQGYNEYLKEVISRTDSNLVVLTLNPEKEGLEIPTEQQLLGAIHAAQGMQLEAWVDNVKTGPLVPAEQLKKPGEIVKEQEGQGRTGTLPRQRAHRPRCLGRRDDTPQTG